jgi:hypothetical protein
MSQWVTNLRISLCIHGQKIIKCVTCFSIFYLFNFSHVVLLKNVGQESITYFFKFVITHGGH